MEQVEKKDWYPETDQEYGETAESFKNYLSVSANLALQGWDASLACSPVARGEPLPPESATQTQLRVRLSRARSSALGAVRWRWGSGGNWG